LFSVVTAVVLGNPNQKLSFVVVFFDPTTAITVTSTTPSDATIAGGRGSAKQALGIDGIPVLRNSSRANSHYPMQQAYPMNENT
jgi:hypothetical protein